MIQIQQLFFKRALPALLLMLSLLAFQPLNAQTLINQALNATVTATYSAPWDGDAVAVNNGEVGYGPAGDGTPELAGANAWWNWSDNRPASESLEYTWASAQTLSKVKLYFWADRTELSGWGDNVAVPESWSLQYWDGSAWADVVLADGQTYTSNLSTPNEVDFVEISTTQLKLILNAQSNGTTYAGVGVTEWEAYTVTTASADASLSGLTASVGTLSPAFSTDTYEYKLTVPASTTSVDLTATVNDTGKATKSGDGTISLSGDKSVEIVVTAEAGNTKSYTVNITENFIFNQSFDGDPNLLSSGNYKTDHAEPRLKSANGWATEYAGNSAGGVFEYGSTAQLNDFTVPALDADGAMPAAGSGCLGVQTSWGDQALYFQDVTLAAGTYKISYKAYNAHTSNTNTQSLVGWVPNSGSSFLSTVSSFPVGAWTADEVLFTLSAETSGRIQIGVKDIAGGSGSNPRLFFDNFNIETVIQSADAQLKMLSVDAGTLIPAFDPDVTKYFVFAPSSTTSVTVSASANDENAQGISGTGAVDVNSGSGYTTITVTAEAGNTKDYVVQVFVNDASNLVSWSDGNGGVATASGSAPNDYGWANTSGYNTWTDYNGGGGCRLRDNYSGYTYEDGGATVTGAQLLLRYDGDAASETAAFTYPVVLEANTVYDFSFDYVYGGSGSAPGVLTAGIGTSNDDVSDVASKDFETANSTTLYRKGTLTFLSGSAGVYYLKFSCNERSWQGVNNLNISTSDVIVWNGVWSNGSGPSVSDDVLIAAPYTVSSDLHVNNLEVGSNGSITVESGASLVIMGSAIGNATINRNTTGDAGYSIVGAPVSGADLADLNADYLYSWDGALYNAETSGTMTPGVGYFAGYDAVSPEISLTGALVSGNQSVAVTGEVSGTHDGFNLVANPYASAIAVDQFIAGNSVSAVYLWDDGGANNGADRAGDYYVVSTIGSVDNTVDLSPSGNGTKGATGAESGFIGSAQGFFVYASADGTVDFTPSMQSTTAGANADVNYYRTVPQSTLKLSLSGAHYNEVLFGFRPDATEGVDSQLDVLKKIGNENFAFYSFIEEGQYAIQGLPELNGETQITLGYDVKESGVYQLSIKEIEGIEGYTVVANYNGVDYDLSEESANLDLSAGKGQIYLTLSAKNILSTERMNSKLQVRGRENGLMINFESNRAEQVSVYTMDGRVIFNSSVVFDGNNAVINATIARNQVYILRVNDQSIKFIMK